MRVLLVCHKPAFPPVDGGTFDSAGLARALAGEGHDVDVLAMAGPRWMEGKEAPPIVQETVRVDSSVKLFRSILTLLRGQADAVARYHSATFARRLDEKLATAAYDIVQFDGCATAQYQAEVRRAVTPRIVLRAHNDEADLWLQRSRTHSWAERVFLRLHAGRLRLIERRTWLSVHGVAAITAELAAACRDQGAPHVHSVPVPQRSSAEPSAMNHELFHIGPLDWWPNRLGLQWFLDSVWPMVRRAHPTLVFRVAGRGSKEFVAPWKDVGVLGDGQVEDAADYMRRRGILVAPTLQGSGMPVKVAQAMSLGKAIVATSIGARGLGAQASRDLLIADSAMDFAAAVGRLVEVPGLAVTTGRAAWEFARANFEERAVGRRLGALYDALRPSR